MVEKKSTPWLKRSTPWLNFSIPWLKEHTMVEVIVYLAFEATFPTPASSTTLSSSSSSSGVAFLNGSLIKEEAIASESLNTIGGTHNNQYTSPSPDVTAGTTITAVSDNLADVISSSVSNVHGIDTNECYSNIFDDVLINLDDLYSQPNLA